MFKVKEKETGNIYTVYQIEQNISYLLFLIYDVYDKWHWEEAYKFEPYEEPQRPLEPSYVPMPYPYPVPSTTPMGNDWWKEPTVTWNCDVKPSSVS